MKKIEGVNVQEGVGDGGSEEDLKGYLILIHCHSGDFLGSASQVSTLSLTFMY